MVWSHPYWLLLVLILPLLWFTLRNKQYVGLSAVSLLRNAKSGRYLHKLPLALFSLAFTCLVVAIAGPQQSHLEGTEVIKSRDIIIAVDISGSMGAAFEGKIPEPEKGNTELDKELPKVVRVPERGSNRYDDDDRRAYQRRIDAAQSAVTRFVRQRFIAKQEDRIGILAFDTEPRWSWPLTDDLKMIYRKGVFIDQGLGGGTNFGDIYPGPIDAACEHFDERGKAATKVVIMVTDGEDNLSSATMDHLHSLLADRSVRLYLIGVGQTLAHYDADIMVLTRSVGGQVFRVENASDMAKCFDSINELERSQIKVDSKIGYHDVFYYFVLAALGLILLDLLSDAFIVTR